MADISDSAEQRSVRASHNVVAAEPPLPGQLKVGASVWASRDLSNDDGLLVRKHTQGKVIGRSASEPSTRVTLCFDEGSDSKGAFTTDIQHGAQSRATAAGFYILLIRLVVQVRLQE